MANLSIAAAESLLRRAKSKMVEHKHMIGELVGAAESFSAPLLVGIAEGRLASDGSGAVQIAGVPLTLGLGVAGAAISASGVADEYGSHIGNMSKGLLGAYGVELGRQLGLGMRLKSGKAIQPGVLNPYKEAQIAAAWLKENPTKTPEDFKHENFKKIGDIAYANTRVGLTGEIPSQYVTIGANPGALSEQQLVNMVQAAAQAQ